MDGAAFTETLIERFARLRFSADISRIAFFSRICAVGIFLFSFFYSSVRKDKSIKCEWETQINVLCSNLTFFFLNALPADFQFQSVDTADCEHPASY